ncbi:MAG: tetratricopeptide repeat-containing sensor histidine kinase [Candidatus Kapaibacterium sp.]
MNETIQQLRDRIQSAESPLARATAINNLVNELRKSNHFDEAIALLDESIQLAESMEGEGEEGAAAFESIARSLSLRSIALRHHADYSHALTAALEALRRYEKLGNIEQQGHLHNSIGNTLAHLGRTEDSLHSYFHALELMETIESQQGIQMSLGNIGTLFAALDEFDRALEYFERALSIAVKHERTEDSASHLCNIGNVYRKLEDYTKASEYYLRALKIFQEAGNTYNATALMGNLGTVYFYSGEYDTALNYLTQALDAAEELEDYYGMSLWRCNLGELFSKQDWHNFNPVKAEEYLLGALSLHEKSGAFVDQYWIHKSLSAVYKLQARWQDALHHSEKYHTLKEEYQSKSAFQTIVDTDAKRKIAAMSKEKEIIDAKNVELELANKLKTKLLGIAAHDLKNPLGNIIGFVRMLIEEIPAPGEHHEMLVMINESAASMHRLIIDLLESSAAEMGAMTLEVAHLDLSELLRIVIYGNLMAAQAKSQRIESSIEDIGITADPRRIQQVLENLLSNAIKYSPAGKVITVRLTQREMMARVEVQDQGQGLTEEDKSKLFGQFQRLSAQPTGGESSTGLGLSIVKQIVELHGGRIWAESAGKNLGATFIVEFPLS